MGQRKWSGSKWIRFSTRCAIYARDGFTCLYCGRSADDGVKLTLDHVEAAELGGSNKPDNLITACLSCNSAKQHKTMRTWLAYLRGRGVDTSGISRRIRAAVRRPIDRAEGRRLARLRGKDLA